MVSAHAHPSHPANRVVLLTKKPPFEQQKKRHGTNAKLDESAGGAHPHRAHGFDLVSYNSPLSAIAAITQAPAEVPCALVVNTKLPNSDLPKWLEILGDVEQSNLASERLRVLLIVESGGKLSPELHKVQTNLKATVCEIDFNLREITDQLHHSGFAQAA